MPLDASGKSSNEEASGKQDGPVAKPKRDFFGRTIKDPVNDLSEAPKPGAYTRSNAQVPGEKGGGKVFVSFHEGYSNAVRKPISLDDLMRSL